mgnify:CR=1 FL=1
MVNPIKFRRSTTPDTAPTFSTHVGEGEIAINTADQRMYSANSTAIFELGANVANGRATLKFYIGNSTINVFSNSTLLQIANSTVTANLTNAGLAVGISIVNNTVVAVGANSVLGAGGLNLGNSTVNSTANSIMVRIANSTASANLTPIGIVVGTSIVNTTSIAAGANVVIGTVSFNIGNTVANNFSNSIFNRIANSTASANLTPIGLVTGTSVVNTTIIAAGANVIIGTAGASIGNSTVNTAYSSTDITRNGVSVVPIGTYHIWIPSYSMIPRTTNGPESNTVETTTNKIMWKTLNFDATVNEHAQFWISMPKSYNNGTLMAQVYWSHANTTTNFGSAWSLQAVAFSDDDGMDSTAFGTEVIVTDTGGTNNDVYITANSAAMTINGTPAANDMICFQVKRLPANAGDTTTVDCRLHGIKLWYTTNAAKDD